MTHYDEIIQDLENSDEVNNVGANMTVLVDEGGLEETISTIEEHGGSVTGTNDHESGHTVYFTFDC